MMPIRSAPQGFRIAVFALVITVLAGASYQRNGVWHTLLSVWQDAASKSPEKARVHNNLGNCYVLAGMYFKGIEEYRRSVALDRNNIEAYYNIAVNLENVGILNQAAYYYDLFCKTETPTYPEQRELACKRAAELARCMK